jgi:acetolactate synthase small subunit
MIGLFKTVKITMAFCALFFLLLPNECPAAGESKTSIKIIVTGTGVITEDDPVKAREDAISESLVAAVGIVIAGMMPVEMLVQNFEKLNEIMYSRKQHYVNGYRVLTETEYNNLYRVIVEAKVSRSRIKKELAQIGFLIERKEMPSILMLIAEQEFEDTFPHYWWGTDMPKTETAAEKAIGLAMTKLGFEMVPHITIPELTEEGITLSTPEPDNEAAVALAKAMRADFVIVGSAVAELAPNTMGEDIRSFKGTVSARAVRADTGEEVAAAFRTDVSVDTDEIVGRNRAVTTAGALAGNDIALQITKALEKKKKSEIRILVQGKGYLSNFAKFRKTVRDIPEVMNIRIQEMKPSEAIVLVECNCDTQVFAKALMLKTFSSFGINISEVEAQQMTIRLVPEKNVMGKELEEVNIRKQHDSEVGN